MNESETLRSAVVKTLAVVGFLATLSLIIFLLITGMKHAPGAFSSLSVIMNKISGYDSDELTIATDKTVVNSGESFQITWTDVPLTGEYRFTYSCDGGVTLEVRGEDGSLVPVKCTDVLTLGDNATGLFLSPTSQEMRFSDIELTVAFSDTEEKVTLENTTKVTVVNAAIPFRDTEEVVEEDTKKEEVPAKKEVAKLATPKVVSPYPASNPNGYTDLKMSIVGSGVLRNGVFSLAPTYNYNQNSALRFDVKNVGTKRSGTWNFSIVLPNGETYTGATQVALGPQEHMEFTLGFFVDKKDGEKITLTPTLYTTEDTNALNNNASVTVSMK